MIVQLKIHSTRGNLLVNWFHFVMLVFMVKFTEEPSKNHQYESEREKLESRAFNYKNIGFRTWHKMKANKAKFHFLQNRSGSRALPLKIIFNKYGNQPVLRKCWETWEETCRCWHFHRVTNADHQGNPSTKKRRKREL